MTTDPFIWLRRILGLWGLMASMHANFDAGVIVGAILMI
jgi:hypothetical protein